tara:strand:- start:1972 stop:2106 length:135 start_codon:yes stop_codon:yes gene_type:complete
VEQKLKKNIRADKKWAVCAQFVFSKNIENAILNAYFVILLFLRF